MYQQLMETIVACLLLTILVSTSINETRRLIRLYHTVHSQQIEALACLQANTIIYAANKEKSLPLSKRLKLGPPLVPTKIDLRCKELSDENAMSHLQCECEPGNRDTTPWRFMVW